MFKFVQLVCVKEVSANTDPAALTSRRSARRAPSINITNMIVSIVVICSCINIIMIITSVNTSISMVDSITCINIIIIIIIMLIIT